MPLTKNRTAWIGVFAIPIIGWVASPIIDAKFKGTPLNGVPGMLTFWIDLAKRPIPAWVLVLILLGALGAGAIAFKLLYKPIPQKHDLKVVVLSTPAPRWSYGAMDRTPVLNVFFHASLAHASTISLRIVTARFKGTEGATPFIPFVVSGPYDETQMIHFGVRPIIAKRGKPLRRKVILIDQFAQEHVTETITFRPATINSQQVQAGGTEIKCFFCGQSIALEDLAESSHVAAHTNCIR